MVHTSLRMLAMFMVLIVLMLPATPLCAAWAEQDSVPRPLYDVDAVDEQIAWAGGGGGLVVRTTDGGDVWETHWTPSGGDISALVAIDADVCIAAEQSGLYWRTADGGLSWTAVFQAGTFINGLHAFDGLRIWSVGDPQGGTFVIPVSADGGVSWSLSPSAPPARVWRCTMSPATW